MSKLKTNKKLKSKPLLATGHLTVGELKKACDENKYILARHWFDNKLEGLNTRVAKILFNKRVFDIDSKTKYVSFIPCDFQTYISHKIPFC